MHLAVQCFPISLSRRTAALTYLTTRSQGAQQSRGGAFFVPHRATGQAELRHTLRWESKAKHGRSLGTLGQPIRRLLENLSAMAKR